MFRLAKLPTSAPPSRSRRCCCSPSPWPATSSASRRPGLLRLRDHLSRYVVLRRGRPWLAASAVGTGVSVCNFQNTVNVVAHGLPLERSVGAPRWSPVLFDPRTFRGRTERLVEGFDEAVLDEVERLGQPLVRQRDRSSPGAPTHRPPAWYTDVGYWTAVGLRGAGGERVAVADPRLTGRALGG